MPKAAVLPVPVWATTDYIALFVQQMRDYHALYRHRMHESQFLDGLKQSRFYAEGVKFIVRLISFLLP